MVVTCRRGSVVGLAPILLRLFEFHTTRLNLKPRDIIYGKDGKDYSLYLDRGIEAVDYHTFFIFKGKSLFYLLILFPRPYEVSRQRVAVSWHDIAIGEPRKLSAGSTSHSQTPPTAGGRAI